MSMSMTTPAGRGTHSPLEVTGVLEQQLKMRGLSVRDYSPKKGSFNEKTKKKRGDQTVRTRLKISSQSKNLDTCLTQISRKI